jgi:hypothetical protein
MPGQSHKPAGSPPDENGHGTGGQFERTVRAQRVVTVPKTTVDHLVYNPNFDDWEDDDVIANKTQGGSGTLSYHESFEWSKSGVVMGITHAGDYVLTRNGRVIAARIFDGTLGNEPDAFFVSEDAQQSKVDLRHLERFADAYQQSSTPQVLPSTEIENKMKKRNDEGLEESERREAEIRAMSLAAKEKTREKYRAEYAAQHGEAHAARLYGPAPRVAGQPQSEIKYYEKLELAGTNATIGRTWDNDAVLESDGEVVAAVIGNTRLELADNWNSSPERIEGVRQLVREFGINTSMSADTWEWLTKDATHEEMNQTFESAGMGKTTSDDLHDMVNARATKSGWDHGAYAVGE